MRLVSRSIYWAGLLGLILGFGAVHARWWAPNPYTYLGSFRFTWGMVLASILIGTSYALGPWV
jgi:hypothetical protein